MNPLARRLAEQAYGRSTSPPGCCICHAQPQARADFRDDVSFAEFNLSRLCQKEQDAIFGKPRTRKGKRLTTPAP